MRLADREGWWLRSAMRACTGTCSLANEGRSSRAIMPVCGGRRLGSGNRLVQSGPWSPFNKILSRRDVKDYDVKRASKYVAHLRHDSSYSPGPEIT